MNAKPRLDWLTARPIAHRGLHDSARGVIENTRSAFAAAIAGGYAIECDLQLTADSNAAVFHDDTLERLTLGSGRVRDHALAQIQSIAVRNSTDRVQSLAELLAQVDGKAPLIIELKSHWDGDVTLVRHVLNALAGYRGNHALMSFDPDMIQAVRTHAPSAIRGMVADRAFDAYYDCLSATRRNELRTLAYLSRAAPDFVGFYFRELPYAPVHALRQQGTPVISWTIRSPEQARDALRHSDQVTFEGYRP